MTTHFTADANNQQIRSESVEQNYLLRGLNFSLHPDVFSPLRNSSTEFFTNAVIDFGVSGSMIEIGTGCGAIGLSALYHCDLSHLTATDISPFAVKKARENADGLGLGHKVVVYEGDVFEPIPAGVKVDTMIWNSPWVDKKVRAGYVMNPIQRCLFDPGYRALTAYIREAGKHLTARGALLLGFGKGGKTELLFMIARQNGYEPVVVAQKPDDKIPGLSSFILYQLARPTGKTTVCLNGQALT